MLASTLLALAIVAQDQIALRAAPRENAAQQVALWAGDSLEVRAEKGDYLQVWDHRRERGGYVRASTLRRISLEPERAAELLAVLRFLKDTPGSEALGIAYAAAYLRAAPAASIDGEVFAALGAMAERLAQRGSGLAGKNGAQVAAQLEVAAAYGVAMRSVEQDGQVRLCYEGEAFRRVLAVPGTAQHKAQAALALTRHECVSLLLTPEERLQHDLWRVEVLDRVETQSLTPLWRHRLNLRRAGVWASLAHQLARRPQTKTETVALAGTRAVEALAAVDREALAEADLSSYSEAALRVGASRWAAEAGAEPVGKLPPNRLALRLAPGKPGETCVLLVDAKHDVQAPLLKRCTYGVVWPASAEANARGSALALAVQPLDTWRELWMFRLKPGGWTVDVLPPAARDPGLGYVEFAGWSKHKEHLLAAREVKLGARYKRSFEVLSLRTLGTVREAQTPDALSEFYRGQSANWKSRTVALR